LQFGKERARLARNEHLYLAAGSGCGNEQQAALAMLRFSPRGTVGRLGESRSQRQGSAVGIGYDDSPLPVWHLGGAGTLHRRDIYDYVR
jgi:hypothetical protein